MSQFAFKRMEEYDPPPPSGAWRDPVGLEDLVAIEEHVDFDEVTPRFEDFEKNLQKICDGEFVDDELGEFDEELTYDTGARVVDVDRMLLRKGLRDAWSSGRLGVSAMGEFLASRCESRDARLARRIREAAEMAAEE